MNALGVYILVSLFFVIATMFEFAIVLLVSRNRLIALDGVGFLHGNRKRIKRTQLIIGNIVRAATFDNATSNGNIEEEEDNRRCLSKPDNIDFACLVVFLLLYFTFNCFYIIHYKSLKWKKNKYAMIAKIIDKHLGYFQKYPISFANLQIS